MTTTDDRPARRPANQPTSPLTGRSLAEDGADFATDLDAPRDPLNPEQAERYLLSLLLSITLQDLRDDALTAVDPEDFWSGHHGQLWAAARSLRDSGAPITKRALLAEAGTATTRRILDRLVDALPRPADYAGHVAEVRHCGQTRRLLVTLDRIRQRALLAEDHAQALSWAHDELAALDAGTAAAPEVLDMTALLDEFLADLDSDTPRRVFATPWPEVNAEIAGGLHGGRFYVIGARPGEGKSIAAHNLAEFAAAAGHSALVFSMEMGHLEVTGRVVASGARVELRDIVTRDLSPWARQQIAEYADRARSYRLAVVDKADVTMPYIKQVCRNHKRRKGLDVVVVDYLQLVHGEGSQRSREQQVAAISRQLKVLSRELDVAVVVPAQLNRDLTRRADARPQKSDLRESGGIEADADVVMLLARGVETDGDRKGEFNGLLNIYIDKNRHGRECHVQLPWRAHYATIG